MRVVVRMIKGETGIGFGAVSDVGRIAVGNGGSDDQLGSFSPVSIAYLVSEHIFSRNTASPAVLSEPGVDHSMLISPLVWARLSQFVYRTVGRYAIKCAGIYFMEESIDENNAFRDANALFRRV
jgi:hypothetical protein